MTQTKLNIELFKKIREKIATVPAAYDQEQYGRAEPDAPCGTAGCIAGWACVLGGALPLDLVRHASIGDPVNVKKGLYNLIPEKAAELLGVSREEADVLFASMPQGCDEDENYQPGWPQPFGHQWEFASEEERADIAVAYLDHIISTGKVLE